MTSKKEKPVKLPEVEATTLDEVAGGCSPVTGALVSGINTLVQRSSQSEPAACDCQGGGGSSINPMMILMLTQLKK